MRQSVEPIQPVAVACPEWPSPPPRASPRPCGQPALRGRPLLPRRPHQRLSSATPSPLPAGGHGRASRAAGVSPRVCLPQAPPSPHGASHCANGRRHAPPAAIKRGSSSGLEAPLASLDQWAVFQPPPTRLCSHLHPRPRPGAWWVPVARALGGPQRGPCAVGDGGVQGLRGRRTVQSPGSGATL